VATRAIPERFLVAFSFAGEQRDLIRSVAEAVERELGAPNVFLDEWFEHYVAGQDADLKLQAIYERCSLAVVCISAHYGDKLWTLAEYEAIRARLMKARVSTDKNGELEILPIRVGDGDVRGIYVNAIVPDARKKTAEQTARLIVDRLRLIVPGPVSPVLAPQQTQVSTEQRQNIPELTVEQIDTFQANKSRIMDALALYEERIPAEERYDLEHMVDLVRDHIDYKFGRGWKMHFLVATFDGRCVGMLICFEDVQVNFAFISYLAARNPRLPGKNPPDVSARLAKGLIETRQRMGLSSPRFLFEVEDPALAQDLKERRRRLSRIKLFDSLAPFEDLHLRALDVPYVQPMLDWPGPGCGKELLLCYAAQGLQTTLPRSEVVDILNWTYNGIYGVESVEDQGTERTYGQHVRELRDSVVQPLPERVRLFKYRDLDALDPRVAARLVPGE
jgi:hypothetical protein